MYVLPLQASIQYCKNGIRLILTWALSVDIVQQTTGKIPKQVKQIMDYKMQRTSDSLNEGLPIKMTRENFQRK